MVMLYAHSVDYLMKMGQSVTDGAALASAMKSVKFQGADSLYASVTYIHM